MFEFTLIWEERGGNLWWEGTKGGRYSLSPETAATADTVGALQPSQKGTGLGKDPEGGICVSPAPAKLPAIYV